MTPAINRWAIFTASLRDAFFLFTAHRSLLTFFLLALAPFLTVGLLPRVFSQNETGQPSSQSTPAPSPSPSPTPPPNLHQWGAVTSFHGLPSDRTHAIAQTEFGVTWFATDGGLARYDGRRTQAITADGLPAGRVLALKVDDDGALWIGTENGGARFANGKFDPISETTGKVITAIISPQRGRAMMTTENGVIFDCQAKLESESRASENESAQGPHVTFAVHTIPDQPLQSADKDHPGPLKITSLVMIGGKLYAGTQGSGIQLIENGEAKGVISKPRSYFINALETDGRGRLWVGVKARGEESSLFDESEPLKPNKANAATGPVMAIARGPRDDVWVGTDGHGAFHLQNGKTIEHFTFEGTGGALRSDHVFGVFVDAEEVVWFATDKGVCRYDPHSTRTENISSDPGANYVRALWRAPKGLLLTGTNSGLYLNDESKKTWSAVAEIGRRIVYALGEDKSGRMLVATVSGLFASTSAANVSSFMRIPPANEKLPQGDNVRAIANAGDSTYIATYGYGVEKLQGTQRTLVWPEPAADNQLREVTSLGRDASDRLVIGTASGGVFFFDGKQATTANALDKLKGDAIWSFANEEQDLWIAAGKGLYLFKSGELKEVVSGVNARSLAIDADKSHARQVWCATSGNGLLRVTFDDQFGAIVSRLDVEQGLPSQRVFAVLSELAADQSERIIAGTNRGVVRYEPGRVAPTVLPARIISQRIHSEEELRAGLHLDYPQNSLLLDVTAISSRTFPEQFQYAFALYDSSGKVIRNKLSHDSQFAIR